jgi:branched-chain amino acid transport system substrate-binding protein
MPGVLSGGSSFWLNPQPVRGLFSAEQKRRRFAMGKRGTCWSLGRCLSLLSAAFLGLAAHPAEAASAPKSVKIGVTAPLTGPAAEAGMGLKQGLLLAMEDWNAKGGVTLKEFNTKVPVEVIIEDCQSKPEVGVSVAEKLFTRDKVDALLGDAFHSSVTMAIMELSPKYGKPIMSIEPASEEIAKKIASNPQRYWNFWKGNWGSTANAEPAFYTYRYLESSAGLKLKGKKIGFIIEDTDYGRSNAERAKELFSGIGFQGVALEAVPLGHTDFYAQLGKLKNLEVDVLMSIFTSLSSGVALAKQFHEVGLKSYHHAVFYPLRPEFIQQAGKSAEHLVFSVLLLHPEANPGHREFGDRIKKRWNAALNSDHSFGYDGLNNILDSIERAGSTDPKKVVEALAKLQTKGVMGRYVFNQTNHQIKHGEEFIPVPAAQIFNGKNQVIWPANMAYGGSFQIPPWLK